ncbi:hypothetical protein DFP73DRAFT_148457 [Morchella snyderi]|nr:hypothetical protein DFP73DRAFT_148457 [Morchella snyderi]
MVGTIDHASRKCHLFPNMTEKNEFGHEYRAIGTESKCNQKMHILLNAQYNYTMAFLHLLSLGLHPTHEASLGMYRPNHRSCVHLNYSSARSTNRLDWTNDFLRPEIRHSRIWCDVTGCLCLREDTRWIFGGGGGVLKHPFVQSDGNIEQTKDGPVHNRRYRDLSRIVKSQTPYRMNEKKKRRKNHKKPPNIDSTSQKTFPPL